jgi:hypothetical protein
VNILYTNNTLGQPGGSELVVLELADAMTALGHSVAAYSTNLGEVGARLRAMSIPVIRNPSACPFIPDIIHGQHHLDAMSALCAFPSVPAIYHCHGYLPWVEIPPQHPRIYSYLGMCERISERIRIELALPSEAVITVPNWVDTDRFASVRDPAKVPSRALILLRSMDTQSWYFNQLVEAFAQTSIQADIWPYNGASLEIAISNYDIVLTSGRSALEAMASGCAVLPLSATSCMDFITSENFELMKRQNFSPLLQTPHLSKQGVEGFLSRYSPLQTAAVTERVRNECNLKKTAHELEEIYHSAISCHHQHSATSHQSLNNELAAISRYLCMIKPFVLDIDRLQEENNSLRELLKKEPSPNRLVLAPPPMLTWSRRTLQGLLVKQRLGKAMQLGAAWTRPIAQLVSSVKNLW